MKRIYLHLLIFFAILSTGTLHAQYAPVTDFQMNTSVPLVEVLDNLSERFHVSINHGGVAAEAEVLDGYFRICPWSIEESMHNVCSATEYNYRYDKEKGEYVVFKPIARHHFQPEQGKDMLNYLTTLSSTKQDWEARKEQLRKDIRHNTGIDRLPAHYQGEVFLGKKRFYGDYYVQNIGLEILPGVYATGSIYHPVKFQKGGCPLIINPHGHYADGRYTELIQYRLAMQARMGCVAIAYDMFAWGVQPMFDKSYHETSLAQPVQILSGLRLLDYGLGLPEIDKDRVAVTGCSGGGSQTMFICALDDRVTLSIPIVMMSSYFHGGCACESGTGIHLSGGGTCNVEIASMFAPKPMLIVSDGADWTSHNPEIAMPFLNHIYGLYEATDKVENVHLADEKHDYGPSKRQATYRFLEKHFGLNVEKLKGKDGCFDESKCVIEDYDLLKVWGPNGEDWPANAIKDPAELARQLHWTK